MARPAGGDDDPDTMKLLLASVLSAFGAAQLAAQNWVTNGDFASGLVGWTQTGYSFNPGIETYDPTGLGASQCFACSPGGLAAPPPYPANTLDQGVIVAKGLVYEISADLSCSVVASNAVANDLVLVTAEVAGVQVASATLNGGTSLLPQLPKDWRARLCARFTAAASGLQPLSLKFSRPSGIANSNSQRVRVDNVSLQLVLGPTCNLDGVHRIGKAQNLLVDGAPGAAYAVLVAPLVLSSGLTIPGVTGTWFLDPPTTAVLVGGTLDANGKATVSVAVPGSTYLTVAPTWLQPAQIAGGQGQLGFHHAIVFTL